MTDSGIDLHAFADLVGDARVVGIGENNHHIAEFGALRAGLVRFLVAELGFRVVAMESGFAEGALVDDWVHGGEGELPAADGFTFRFGDAPEVAELVSWLRERGDVTFAGLDVPGSGGSPVPALDRLRTWARDTGADAAALTVAADGAAAATELYTSANNGIAAGRYAALDTAERAAATAAVSRLLLRVEAVSPADPVARHLALGAVRLDEQLREFAALGIPDPPPLAMSSRDVHMAASVRLLRALHGPDTRIVVLQHNGHLQRVPMQLMPGVHIRTCGTYLAAELGEDYRAVGITAVSGTTTTVGLDESARHGIAVGEVALDPPDPDGIEAALAADAPVLADLRPRRGRPGPSSVRHAHITSPVDVVQAYDGMFCLPTMSPAFTG